MECKKSFRKSLLAGLLLVAAVMLLAVPSLAAGTVKITSVNAGSGTAKVTWKSLANIQGYNVYVTDPSGSTKLAGKAAASATSYTVRNLKSGKKYRIYVKAYDAEGEGPKSQTVAVTCNLKALKKVKGLNAQGRDKKVRLVWKKNSGASGYVVYQKNSKGEFVKIKTVKKNRAYVSKLSNGKEYTFRVAPYKKEGSTNVVGQMSGNVSAKPVNSKPIKKIHAYYYKGTMRQSYTAKGKKIPSGASVKVVSYDGSKARIIYQKKTYTVPRSVLGVSGIITNSKKAYSLAQAEAFVNFKGYSSPTKYFMWVSTYTQHVYIFKGYRYHWKAIKRCICSTGMFRSEKGKAVETHIGKGVVRGRQYTFYFAPDQVAYYCTSMHPGGWFHSWLYYPGGGKYPNIGTIGSPASHGCVRIELNNAKWIYENIPDNTNYMVF